MTAAVAKSLRRFHAALAAGLLLATALPVAAVIGSARDITQRRFACG